MNPSTITKEIYEKIKLSIELMIQNNSNENSDILIYAGEVNADLTITFYDLEPNEPKEDNVQSYMIHNFLNERDFKGNDELCFEDLVKDALKDYIKNEFEPKYEDIYTLWFQTDMDEAEEIA